MTDNTTLVSTNDLVGAPLNYAVWKATREDISNHDLFLFSSFINPSVDWCDIGPIIKDYQIALIPESHDGMIGTENSELWYANIYAGGGEQYTTNMCNTPLIAACRAIVGSVFGDSVQIPNELLECDE